MSNVLVTNVYSQQADDLDGSTYVRVSVVLHGEKSIGVDIRLGQSSDECAAVFRLLADAIDATSRRMQHIA